ncbi:MAG: protein kinase [Chlamydiales bacterium]|nr:protein kinase [Chlamydiales bacterium]
MSTVTSHSFVTLDLEYSPSLEKAKGFQRAAKICYPSLSLFDVADIYHYIKTNYEALLAEAYESLDGFVYKGASANKLPRAIEVLRDGDVRVHFNKKRLGDYTFCPGTFKYKVRTAVSCNLEEMIVVGISKADTLKLRADIEREYGVLKELEGVRGVASALSLNFIGGKKGCEKAFLEQPYYRLGALDEKNEEGLEYDYLEKDQLRITLDVLYGLKGCKAREILHLDVKRDNIFVDITRDANTGKEECSGYLGDFGLSCRSSNHERLQVASGTPIYFSPEYAKSFERGSSPFLRSVSEDMWALGCALFEMYYAKHPHWILRNESGDEKKAIRKQMRAIINLQQGEIVTITPEHMKKSPLQCLIQEMLMVSKEERLSDPEVAIAKYEEFILQRIQDLEQAE